MTRGLANNNPGNIRHGEDWDGLTKDQSGDPEFAQFISPEYGIRAVFKIIHTYDTKYGLSTIEGIVSRWAPPVENDTEAYIAFVEGYTGLARDAELVEGDMVPVVQAIIKMENGTQPYPLAVVKAGKDLAYAAETPTTEAPKTEPITAEKFQSGLESTMRFLIEGVSPGTDINYAKQGSERAMNAFHNGDAAQMGIGLAEMVAGIGGTVIPFSGKIRAGAKEGLDPKYITGVSSKAVKK